jgi:hypothetical protein
MDEAGLFDEVVLGEAQPAFAERMPEAVGQHGTVLGQVLFDVIQTDLTQIVGHVQTGFSHDSSLGYALKPDYGLLSLFGRGLQSDMAGDSQ